MDVEWQKDVPEKHGYYLVAWKKNETQVVVSELWYNPDAVYPWWFTRGYAWQLRRPGTGDALVREVVAWMPIPEPPPEDW